MSCVGPWQTLWEQARLKQGANLVLVVAHPDDEVIGAGAQLPGWPGATFIHVTDGAPRNMGDALRMGFATRAAYAQARRQELDRALASAGVRPGAARCLGVVDQEASLRIAEIARALAECFRQPNLEVVLTHPYEGGHPDHDATALAVHLACNCLHREAHPAPVILEMTSYHNRAGRMCPGEFLPGSGDGTLALDLDPLQRRLKRQLFDCFATQRMVLEGFPIAAERFRLAPAYDFINPPHGGRLYYEMFDWGATGQEWRRRASDAMAQFGLPPGAGPET